MKPIYMIEEVRAIADITILAEAPRSLKGDSTIDVGDVDYPIYWINRINVPKQYRGKKYGRKILDMILKDADEEQATLILQPYPSGGLIRDQLVSWYKRNGFEFLPDQSYFMVRYPNGE